MPDDLTNQADVGVFGWLTAASDMIDRGTTLLTIGGLVLFVLAFIKKGLPAAVRVMPVDGVAKHAAMWRWDRRMFASRHPKRHRDFDLVSLELGRSWWVRYPEQDWMLVDRSGRQIGQYCLCPISDAAYRDLLSGKRIETQLRNSDVIAHTEVSAHAYWYLANFMCARRAKGLPQWISDLARDVMIHHISRRVLDAPAFRTHGGREIFIVTFAEAPSIGKVAEAVGFTQAKPGARKTARRKVRELRVDRQVAARFLAESGARLALRNFSAYLISLRRSELYRQPGEFH